MPELIRTTIADELDDIAEGMSLYPWMSTSPEGIALIRAAAARIRELEADNARLRTENHDTSEALRSMLETARARAANENEAGFEKGGM